MRNENGISVTVIRKQKYTVENILIMIETNQNDILKNGKYVKP